MVHLVKKFLKKNNYNDKDEEFETSYLSHPNYPSLYALTDTLNLIGVENIAARIPKEQFIELPQYFISMLDNNFILVNKKENYVEIESLKGKKTKLSFDDFLNKWSQIVVAIEPNEKIANKTNQNKTKWYLFLLPCITLLTLSIIINPHTLYSAILLFTSILGVGIGYFIIQEKLGTTNEFTSKICNLGNNTSCDSVIKSTKGEISKWLDLSDLTILFFGTNLFTLVINPNTFKVISFLSLLSIPVVIYSFWLQKIELKKWCALCLSISFIIILQSLVNVVIVAPFQFNLNNTLFYILSLTIVVSIWFTLKAFLFENKDLTDDNNKLKRFKRNFSIFNSLTKKITFLENFDTLNGIQFGDSKAINKLTLFLSPSCGHCHTAFKEAYELQQMYPEKFSFEVLFNINPENNENPFRSIVESLLLIHSLNPEKAKEAIIDWHLHRFEIDKWKDKWLINTSNNEDIIYEIQKQYGWCFVNNFNYTPIKIINQKLYPQDYSISDFKYFINEVEEETFFLSHK